MTQYNKAIALPSVTYSQHRPNLQVQSNPHARGRKKAKKDSLSIGGEISMKPELAQ